jgi:beta-glucosidase
VRRWPTCCSAAPDRAAGCRSPGTGTAADLPPITDYAIRPSSTSPGRTYQYFTGPVTFAFGHGLTYDPVRYSGLEMDRTRADADDTVQVRLRLENPGPRPVDEVVQLYVSTPDAPPEAERPLSRLRGSAGWRSRRARAGR